MVGRHVRCVEPHLLGIKPLLEIIQTYLEFEVCEEDVKYFVQLPVLQSLHYNFCQKCIRPLSSLYNDMCEEAMDLFLYLIGGKNSGCFENIYPQMNRIGLTTLGRNK